MSHYSVAVFTREGQTVEELLAPYDENLTVEKYIEFSRQEAIDYARKHFKTEGKTDRECWQMLADDAGEGMTDEDGNIYSTYNPRSRWDWYMEGGRWGGFLNHSRDSAKVRDIDFSLDQEAYEDALRFWDTVVDHKPVPDGEEMHSLYTEEYYRDYYGDRETYARHQAQFSTFAVVTPDGEWHEKGRMGWFGCSSETGEEARDWEDHYKERFLDTADPNWELHIIDCHI